MLIGYTPVPPATITPESILKLSITYPTSSRSTFRFSVTTGAAPSSVSVNPSSDQALPTFGLPSAAKVVLAALGRPKVGNAWSLEGFTLTLLGAAPVVTENLKR